MQRQKDGSSGPASAKAFILYSHNFIAIPESRKRHLACQKHLLAPLAQALTGISARVMPDA